MRALLSFLLAIAAALSLALISPDAVHAASSTSPPPCYDKPACAMGAHGVYNSDPANVSAMSACIAKVVTPGTLAAPCTIGVWGDSTSAGMYSNGASITNSLKAGSWPSRLVQQLNALGVPASDDSALGTNGAGCGGCATLSTYDPRITAVGSWGPAGNGPGVCIDQCLANSSDTTSFSYKPQIKSNTFIVWYIQNAAFTQFTITDEASDTTTCTQTGSSNWASCTLTAAATGYHTYSIQKTSAGGTTYIAGYLARDTGLPRVEIVNAGDPNSCAAQASSGGCNTNYWDQTAAPYSPRQAIVNLAFNGWLGVLGENDATQNGALGSPTLAQFQTSIQNMITTTKSSSSFLIMSSPIPVSSSATPLATQAQFNNALFALAAKNNVPIIDLPHLWVSYTQANTDGKMQNTGHPSGIGYSAWASQFLQILVPGVGSSLAPTGTVMGNPSSQTAPMVPTATPAVTSLALGGCTIGTNALCASGGGITLSGNQNYTPGTTGVQYKQAAATFNDNVTAANGTVANDYLNVLGSTALTATNANVTHTAEVTLDIEPPTCSGNLTCPGMNALRLGGNLVMGGATINSISAIVANGTSSYELSNTPSAAAVPSVIPNRGSINTGLGGASGSADLIAAGVNVVHTTSTTVGLPVLASSSAAQTGTVCWTTGGGNLTVDTTTTCLLSLEEAKNITAGIDPDTALAEEMRIRPFWGSYKRGGHMTDFREHAMLGAHQVESVDQRLVGYDPKGRLQGVRYADSITALNVAAIQGLKRKTDWLTDEIDVLIAAVMMLFGWNVWLTARRSSRIR